MLNRDLKMEFSNLVCRFGEKVLLDMFSEIVYPAFFEKNVREYGERNSYFFDDVQLVSFNQDGEVVVGVAGRFIKDTILVSEQVYSEGGLERVNKKIPSSPSSIFLIILNNHRMIYVRENVGSPTQDNFKATLLSFLRKSHGEYIEKKVNKIYEAREKDTVVYKKDIREKLLEKVGRPSLSITTLPSGQSIIDFVERFEKLKKIDIGFSDRNHESDNNGFFRQMQNKKDKVGSKKSTITHENSMGLNKQEVIVEIDQAAKQGNQTVRLSGVDRHGDGLVGNNDSFKLSKDIDNLPYGIKEAAVKLYESFSELVNDSLIVIQTDTPKIKKIVGSIYERMKRNGG